MKFFLEKESMEINNAMEIIKMHIGIDKFKNLMVNVVNAGDNLKICCEDKKAIITCSEKVLVFRALGLIAEKIDNGYSSFEIEEPVNFRTCGVMIDCSRNAVITVNSMKNILLNMAAMGLNMAMLYTEDTYEVEGYPYFGYMRGRYTQNELREIDDFAYLLGIEMIPCLQTLSHLESALRWKATDDIRGTRSTLLVGEDKTYDFIEACIKSISKSFRSNKIHIGMDEAMDIGQGTYLQKNGYKKSDELFLEHLNRVVLITEKYHLKPMMWDDMFMTISSKAHDYYDLDADVPKEIIDRIPNIDLVFWDYTHYDEDTISKLLEKTIKTGKNAIFAGGIRNWMGMSVNMDHTFRNTNAALNVCKKLNVKEVIATIWGNGGNQSNIYETLLGMQLYAEHCYCNNPTKERVDRRFKACTGCNADLFYALDLETINEHTNTGAGKDIWVNLTSQILWQDILIGLVDKNLSCLNYKKIYSDKFEEFNLLKNENKKFDFLIEYTKKLYEVIISKGDIGIRIKQLYDENNITSIKNIVYELNILVNKVEALRDIHEISWFKTYKPFGWETLDVRYGGLINRIKYAARRLSKYTDGEITIIEELEEKRLFYNTAEKDLPNEGICMIHLIPQIIASSLAE